MFDHIGAAWQILLGVVATVGGLVETRLKSHWNGKNITQLWEKKADAEAFEKLEIRVHENFAELSAKKADAEAFRKLEAKLDGIDRWTRDHEVEANKYRLESAERFASVEKSNEINVSANKELVRAIGRLESALEKMEKKFEGLTTKMEDAMARRRGSDHG